LIQDLFVNYFWWTPTYKKDTWIIWSQPKCSIDLFAVSIKLTDNSNCVAFIPFAQKFTVTSSSIVGYSLSVLL